MQERKHRTQLADICSLKNNVMNKNNKNDGRQQRKENNVLSFA